MIVSVFQGLVEAMPAVHHLSFSVRYVASPGFFLDVDSTPSGCSLSLSLSPPLPLPLPLPVCMYLHVRHVDLSVSGLWGGGDSCPGSTGVLTEVILSPFSRLAVLSGDSATTFHSVANLGDLVV